MSDVWWLPLAVQGDTMTWRVPLARNQCGTVMCRCAIIMIMMTSTAVNINVNITAEKTK
jgi:hypothetical protein